VEMFEKHVAAVLKDSRSAKRGQYGPGFVDQFLKFGHSAQGGEHGLLRTGDGLTIHLLVGHLVVLPICIPSTFTPDQRSLPTVSEGFRIEFQLFVLTLNDFPTHLCLHLPFNISGLTSAICPTEFQFRSPCALPSLQQP
jgi:hypothetical protein